MMLPMIMEVADQKPIFLASDEVLDIIKQPALPPMAGQSDGEDKEEIQAATPDDDLPFFISNIYL